MLNKRITGIAFLHMLVSSAIAGMSPEIKALYEQENAEAAQHVRIQNSKLINAVLKNNTLEIDVALAGGAHIDRARSITGGEPALILATRNVRKTMIPFLLSRNADPNVTHSNHIRSALFYAIQAEALIADKLSMITSLLEGGADINFRDISELTPLAAAVMVDQAQVVEFLLTRGARVNVRDRYGKSLLDFMHNNKKILKLLLDAGENPDYQKKGGNPIIFDIAYTHEQDPMGFTLYALQELLIRGADLSVTNHHGDNLLAIAVKCRNKMVVEFFLKNGVKADTKNIWGDTPADIAKYMVTAWKDQSAREVYELLK